MDWVRSFYCFHCFWLLHVYMHVVILYIYFILYTDLIPGVSEFKGRVHCVSTEHGAAEDWGFSDRLQQRDFPPPESCECWDLMYMYI